MMWRAERFNSAGVIVSNTQIYIGYFLGTLNGHDASASTFSTLLH